MRKVDVRRRLPFTPGRIPGTRPSLSAAGPYVEYAGNLYNKDECAFMDGMWKPTDPREGCIDKFPE